MADKHTEIYFEDAIVEYLTQHGWLAGDSAGYDRELALYPEDVLGWLQDTQPTEWAKIRKMHNGSTEKMVLQRLVKVMDKEGSLAVLRHGFKDISAQFELCQFKPSQTMNDTILEKFSKVRLRVVRQLHYSLSNENAIDLVLFINGIPVATLELKSDFTQAVEDAIRQYRTNRLPKDPVSKKDESLLNFKKRALVHFAVSTREVYMTTELKGKETVFLPFNLGDDGGKGNPPNPNGYPVSYLWERILAKDTFLGIVGKFVHLEKKTLDMPDGSKKVKESLIFPRFHQWDCVTRLIATARAEGAGHRYLIQHSAGSGKTNSIAWLAHQLSSLHDVNNQKVFDSIIVITDRNVLDTQLQEAIYQFEHKGGVIAKITSEHGSKSSKLVQALATGKLIIIVTIQTFPFVMDEIRKTTSLKDRTFAIIADEAHSSQAGRVSKKLRRVLTSEKLEEQEEYEDVDAEDVLAAQAHNGLFPPNISYFAFTATPKAKTIELFGRLPRPDELPSDTNIPQPFHVYTMQQAIEERFILDVLQNYISYRWAFKLAHNGQDYDEKQVDENRALKSLMRWVRLHPYNIAQKVQVIVEHFRQNVMWRLNGKAKAMVVTGSRKEAVRYKLAMEKYIRDQKYKDIQVLVAFSGDVEDKESGLQPFNEHNMNPGLKGREIREAFGTGEYQVMLVANKFQTGFDQPLLVAMYVDKLLAGINAVQTLSRLNRTYPGKETTFVLDFVNDPDDILFAFQQYYKIAELSEVKDPNLIHEIQAKLDGLCLYTEEEVEAFAKAYVVPRVKQSTLVAIIEPVAARYGDAVAAAKAKEDKLRLGELELFRKNMQSFLRVYDFLSQIVDYGSSNLEKRSIFYRCLLPYLGGRHEHEAIDLSQVIMTHYHLGKKQEGALDLDQEPEKDTALKPITDVGSGSAHDPERVYLAQLIQTLNDLFEGELSDADLIHYAYHIRDKMLESDIVRQQARANTKERLAISPDFEKQLEGAIIDAFNSHASMSKQMLQDKDRQKRFGAMIVDLIYRGLDQAVDPENQLK